MSRVSKRLGRLGISLLSFCLLFLFANHIYTNFSTPCGFGFGGYHERLQRNALKAEFKESLPELFELVSFECDGFMDLGVKAEFMLNKRAGDKLQAELDSTFEQNQNHELFPDNKKKKQTRFELSNKITEYMLPGHGDLYAREITMIIDQEAPSSYTIQFYGYQW